MKKIIVCACCLAMLHPVIGQVYIRASVGYNLPLGSQLMGTEEIYKENQNEAYSATFRGVYGSYGSGFSANIAFGGTFKDGMLGYDAAFGYLTGKEYSVKSLSDYSQYTYSSEIKSKATSLQFAPALTFAVGAGKFQPFSRFGPVIALTKMEESRTDISTYEALSSTVWKYEFTDGISIGLRGTVGVNYNLSDNLKLFTEINFLSMSYAPKTLTLKDYVVNGESQIENIPKEDRVFELDKEASLGGEEGRPPLRTPLTMGSWGFQVGIQFSF